MNELRLTRSLLDEMKQDLRRPHEFAAERVGFVFGKLGSLDENESLILLTRYLPLEDDRYEDRPMVGAYIGEQAMTEAMNEVYRSRGDREGIFHVHFHEHYGPTGMSSVDKRDVPRMIPNFASVSKSAPHGIIILSEDHASAWARLPGSKDLERVPKVVVVGAPLSVLKEGKPW